MKAGIWGVGLIAGTHAQAIKSLGVDLEAVVGTNDARTESFARRFGAPKYGTDASILFEKDIDAVHVCTPPALHYGMVKRLLEAGKHVLCEKPLCLNNKEALELASMARDKGLVCSVNFNVRYHIACQKAREIVSDDSFGRLTLVHGSYLQEYNAFPAPLDWRYNEALAGKMRAVTEIGSHWVDLAQYISGDMITGVSATFGRFNPKRHLDGNMMYPASSAGEGDLFEVTSEDAASVSLRFSRGAIGSVLLSEVSHGRVNRLSLEVVGENRSLWWNSEDNNALCTAGRGTGVNNEIFGFGNGFFDTFLSLIGEFYQAARAGAMPERASFPTFDEGANIVEICNAIYESAENDSRWVAVKR